MVRWRGWTASLESREPPLHRERLTASCAISNDEGGGGTSGTNFHRNDGPKTVATQSRSYCLSSLRKRSFAASHSPCRSRVRSPRLGKPATRMVPSTVSPTRLTRCGPFSPPSSTSEVENIELISVFEEGGGTHFGNMKTHKFSRFSRTTSHATTSRSSLDAIHSHYGCGYCDPRDA